jgi:NAD(P)-dependent dehydrogenase (short-subunit alcohol dehydrogenase family)
MPSLGSGGILPPTTCWNKFAMAPKSALIVGASRGLGLGLVQEYAARGWDVIGTVRNSGTLLHKVPGVEIETLDVNDADQIAALGERWKDRTFDLLFVNAGVKGDTAANIGEVPTEEFTRVMATNALGPLRVLETLGGLVTPGGVMAVMSSGLGSVAGNNGSGWETYRASKAALNTLMKSFASRQRTSQTFLVISPGWVKTDMGGPGAPLDVATSVRGIADTIGKRQGNGGVAFVGYDNKEIAW